MITLLLSFLSSAHAIPVKGWPADYDTFISAQVTPSMVAVKSLDFCPGYKTMNEATKRKTWAIILHGIAIPESGLNPFSTYIEKTMGIDKYTGQQVKSEGLMQLSYQDSQWETGPYCQKISWATDKNKVLTDPTKTIFDPNINLGCSIEIMDKLLKKYNDTKGAVFAIGRYWSTFRRGKCAARSYIAKQSTCGIEPNGCK